MDVKFGKIRPNSSSNFFIDSIVSDSEENFFASASEYPLKGKKQETPSTGTRINDYDSSILENNAYQGLPDEAFKLEHKISLIEQSLAKINKEIETIDGLGYDIQVNELKIRKQMIEEELILLNKKYTCMGFSSKISGHIASAVNLASSGKNNSIDKIKNFVTKKILVKLSKKIGYSQSMKEALDSLNNINSSVDELIQLQVPYGEMIERYEKLTAYLNKANIIHSQISKNINTSNIKKA